MAKLADNSTLEITEMSIRKGTSDLIVDIRDLFIQCTIYEDIDLPVITGQCIVSDSVGLVELFPILGNEIITIKYRTDDYHPEFSRTFYIKKVSDYTQQATKKVGYVLHLVSLPEYENIQRRVSRSFVNSTSEIVENICTNMLGIDKDFLFIEPTYETKRIVFPNIRPLSVIKRMTEVSLRPNSDDQVADYRFFENSEGHHFASMKTMGQQKSIQSLFYGDSPSNAKQRNYDKIRGFKYVELFDQHKNISQGLYCQRAFIIDTMSKTFDVLDTKYSDNFDATTHMEENGSKIGGNIDQDLNEACDISLFTNHKDYVYDDRYKFQPIRKIQNLGFSNYKVLVECEGNTRQTVGKVVNFDLHSIKQSSISDLDTKISGRYLITRKKHSIFPTECVNTIELSKDCVKGV